MSRIRSIHPGFASDESFVTVSRDARLFYLLLLTECDDQGLFEWKPLTLKMRIFPADNIDCGTLLTELLAIDAVCSYETDGRKLGAVRNFRKYQRPKSPNALLPMPDNLRSYVCLSPPIGEIIRLGPSPIPPKGEKSPQMEGGGGRMEDGKKESSASACTDPPSPAVAVIQVFDEARATAFGETQRRPWPTGTDRTVAERWLAAGATLELCRDVCGAQCARMAAKGKRPPESLALFERDIADAIAAAQRPMAAGKATNGQAPSDDGEEKRHANRDRLRLDAWREGADWNPNWGPEPSAEQRRKSA